MRSFLVTACLLLAVWAIIPSSKQRSCPLGLDVDAECQHFTRGLELADRGMRAEAIREYQQAICLDPQDEVAKQNLSELLQEEGPLNQGRLPTGRDRREGQSEARNVR